MPKVIANGHSYIYPIIDIMKLFFNNVEIFDIFVVAKDDKLVITSTYLNNKVVTSWEISGEQFKIESEEFCEYPKREIKRQLYIALSTITGIKFPWGSLTGIRPTIIATECLKTPEKLTNFYFVSPQKADLSIKTAIKENEILSGFSHSSYHCYIGIPFCRTRCLYCSFISQEYQQSEKWVLLYIDALIKEIDSCMPKVSNNLITLYIGGGTPTALPDDLFEKVLYEASKYTKGKKFKEFTVEAGRADTITKSKLEIMKKYNVNRICINPQTMKDKTLINIGRNHSSNQVLEAVELAKSVSFPVINMDLIAGLPGETLEDFKISLDTVLSLNPQNVTIHSLALKRTSEMTRLLRDNKKSIEKNCNCLADSVSNSNCNCLADSVSNSTQLIDEVDLDNLTMPGEIISDMIEYSNKKLEKNGFIPYYLYRQKEIIGGHENVGYSLPGNECLYNVAMMSDQCSIMALGAGSVSKYISKGEPDVKMLRQANLKDLRGYISRIDEMIERKMELFGRD